jgi:hypothetical protein
MGSFLKTASKQVGDVRNFLRDAAGSNGIKYGAEKGARHILYIPYTSQSVVDAETGAETVSKQLYAISGKVHEWTTADGKFRATVCLKDVIRSADDGTVINDGTCPFCDRIADAWEIYKYRKEKEDMDCQLTGDARKQHLEKANHSFADERKAKETRDYMYILVVKFRTNDAGAEVLGTDGLPEYDLKVMKLSSSRVEKIQQQIANSGADFAGSELIFEYPNVEDRRLLVSQSTTTPVFPNNMLTVKYAALVNKINQDAAKFEWEGIEKAFTEWAGMTSLEAKTITDSQFEQWDSYKKELLTNPQAKYLEYVVATPTAKPSLGGADGTTPVVPVIPTIPTANTQSQAGIGVPPVAAPTVPPVAPAPTAQAAPTAPVPPVAAPDPNSVFAANGTAAPSITL